MLILRFEAETRRVKQAENEILLADLLSSHHSHLILFGMDLISARSQHSLTHSLTWQVQGNIFGEIIDLRIG
jgi:hypothetical protein